MTKTSPIKVASPSRFRPVWDFPGFSGLTIGFFAFLYVPILVLVAYSFNGSKFAMVWSEFSWRWYIKLLENDDIHSAAVNSLIVAFTAAPIATIMATLAALVMVRGGEFRGRDFTAGLITLPLMVPEIVTAVATLIFFALLNINLGLINVILAHTVFCIPFAYMPIKAALEAMDPGLEVAAQDLYADYWQAFYHVTLPLLTPGIISGFMLAFVISIDDFIITLMVAGAGSTTLPVYIYSMIRTGVTPEVNAVSTLLLAVSIVLVSVYWLLSSANRKGGAMG
jgi:spermidine/putrescine transport system permease protein